MGELTNPYVGPRTFSKEERNLFFGREKEARNLVSLVISERLVMFYAQSGAGKSSLINTRLIPKLVEEEGFVALPVGRVSGELPPGISQVNNIFVFNLLLSLEQGDVSPTLFTQMELSEFLSHLMTSDGEYYHYEADLAVSAETAVSADDDPGDEPPHILIIDQFEEILTTHLTRWQDREAFFRQLNQAILDDPLLWVMLSLREDYVPALQPYHRLLFNSMRARFYMQRMEAEAAIEAIEQPATLGKRPFAPGVAQTLVENLRQIRVSGTANTQPGQFVEPVQLQVVCYQLWENLKHRPPAPITHKDLEEVGDVDAALSLFYEHAVSRAIAETHVSEVELRNWFDRKLITEAATRGIVYQGETETASMDNQVVKVLADQFLLRPEIRAGGTWYELVHDRFVSPILEANQEWRLRQSPLLRAAEEWDRNGRLRTHLYRGDQLKTTLETIDRPKQERLVQEFLTTCEEAQSQQDLAEANAKAAEQARIAAAKARTAQRLRYLTYALTVVLLLAIGASIWASIAQSRANTQASLAIANAREAAANAEEAAANALDAEIARAQAVTARDAAETARAEAETANNEAQIARAQAEANARLAEIARTEAEANAQIADIARAQAESLGRLALAQFLAALSPRIIENQNDTELATLLTMESLRISREVNNQDEGLINNTLRDLLTKPFFNTRLVGQPAFVYALAFSPDGRWLASTDTEGFLLLWDLWADSESYDVLTAEGSQVVQFSPDGQTLAVTTWDGQVVLWDMRSFLAEEAEIPEPMRTLQLGKEVAQLVFGPADRGLYARTTDGSVWYWNLADLAVDGEPVYIEQDKDVVTLALSGNGRYLAGFVRGLVLIRDLDSPARAVIRTFDSGRDDIVHYAAFSPDNKSLATGSDSGNVAIWNFLGTSSNVLQTRFQPPQETTIGNLQFSPDGRWLATISEEDWTIRLYDRSNPNSTPFVLRGHTSGLQTLAFSPTNEFLASGSDDRTVRLWQLQPSEVSPVVFAGAEEMLIYADYQMETGEITGVGELFQEPVQYIMYTWNTNDPLQPQTRIPIPFNLAVDIIETEHVYIDPPVRVHPPLHLLATAGANGVVDLWQYEPGRTRLTNAGQLTGNTAALTTIVFSHDGQQVAAATMAQEIYLWNRSEPDAPQVLHGFSGEIGAMSFNHTGTQLVAVDLTIEPIIYLWQLDEAMSLPWKIPSGHTDIVSAVAWSQDDSRLATGSYDLSIRLWNVAEMETAVGDDAIPALELIGHSDWIFSLAFSPNAEQLASSSWDRTIRLWDLQADNPSNSVTVLKGHTGTIRNVAFSSDGSHIVSASDDYTLRTWVADIDQFVSTACEQVRRNLTLGEWDLFLADDTYHQTCTNRPVHSSVETAVSSSENELPEIDDPYRFESLVQHL